MTEYFAVMLLLMAPAILLPQRNPSRPAWVFAFLLLLVFIGLRHKVGMDWNNYLVMIERAGSGSYLQSHTVAEPAYATILWLSSQSGFGMYLANFVSSIVLLLGVFRFARSTPLPWVALVCAFPMLLVVVGMSANRQAAAIGVLLWLVADWNNVSLKARVALTALASMFHLSAIFFLIFAAMGLKLKVSYKAVLIAVLGIVCLAYLQLSGGAEYYDQAYISGQDETTFSIGATQHVLLNGLPALLLVIAGRFRPVLFPTAIIQQMAWMAMALIPLAFIFSVASGRMTLYLFPVSMWVFSALPGIFREPSAKAMIRTLVCGAQFMVLWVWLNYANSSLAHVPYSNALFMSGWELHL